MGFTVLFEMEGVTTAQYDNIWKVLERIGETAPKGRRFHVGSPTPSGFYVVDVWDSMEELDKFAKAALVPAMIESGVTPGQPRVLPSHLIVAR
jgi:hypothetical protein